MEYLTGALAPERRRYLAQPDVAHPFVDVALLLQAVQLERAPRHTSSNFLALVQIIDTRLDHLHAIAKVIGLAAAVGSSERADVQIDVAGFAAGGERGAVDKHIAGQPVVRVGDLDELRVAVGEVVIGHVGISAAAPPDIEAAGLERDA